VKGQSIELGFAGYVLDWLTLATASEQVKVACCGVPGKLFVQMRHQPSFVFSK
jgi:hypothetical protein